MGDRAQVKIIMYDKDPPVYLYTHWKGCRIEKLVCNALKRKQRWDDPEYLARIIFDEMKEKDFNEETGFGIGTSEHEDIHTLITVDGMRKIVDIKKYDEPDIRLTIKEFIEQHNNKD